MALKAGDVILTPFPFRDKAAESTRPAVVLSGTSYNQQGDVVVAAITSRRACRRITHCRIGRRLDWSSHPLFAC
jgi:mRNA-degrading endonuclease toxin of MazEF toxin-antitoxin module